MQGLLAVALAFYLMGAIVMFFYTLGETGLAHASTAAILWPYLALRAFVGQALKL